MTTSAQATDALSALLPTGFRAGLPLSRDYPCSNMPSDRKTAAIVGEAVEAFREFSVMPLWHFPKTKGQRGLMCVEGPFDNLYTVDPDPKRADREALILWLIIADHMPRERAEAVADQMRAA